MSEDTRPAISWAEFERIVDQAVWHRLERSQSYRYAASAEEQAEVEERVTDQVVADYEAKYRIT